MDRAQHTQEISKAHFTQTFSNPIQPTIIKSAHIESSMQNNEIKEEKKKDSHITKMPSTHTTQDTKQDIKKKLPKNLFLKTQDLLEKMADLSIFDADSLQKGMKIDLPNKSDSLFFELHIGAELHLACAYNYVLDERAFAKKESPYLHFTRCEVVTKIAPDLVKICVPTKNAFDYRVRSSGVDTRLFYEHPLRLCPVCIDALCDILSKKHKRMIAKNQIKEEEIMGLLFKNKLKNLVL